MHKYVSCFITTFVRKEFVTYTVSMFFNVAKIHSDANELTSPGYERLARGNRKWKKKYYYVGTGRTEA